MQGVQIWVDPIGLDHNVRQYLRSPEAKAVFDELDISFFEALIMTMFLFFVGLILLPTIKWTTTGLGLLWGCLTLAPFRTVGNVRSATESLRPLLGHGVIIGPKGHACVIGTFSLDNPGVNGWLTQVAAFLGHLYTNGPSSPDQMNLYELVRDDTFQATRRVRLPEPFAQGHEIYLFDVMIDLNQAVTTPSGSALMLFVATGQESGAIKQIPWHVAGNAVRIGLTPG